MPVTKRQVNSIAKAGDIKLKGDVTLTGGANITLTQSGQDISIAGAAGGSVATDAIWDAKGDLAVGTGANTASKLTVGANDTVLVAASGEVTGAKWSAALAGLTLTTPVINTSISGTAIATGAEVTTGTDDTQIVTPKALGDAGVNTRLASKKITGSRDMTVASGNVSYTGIGFVPTSIAAVAAVNATTVGSVGYADASKAAIAFCAIFTNLFYANLHSALIDLAVATGSNDQYATVASYDADGFTLTWTKSNSPTGNATLGFICYK